MEFARYSAARVIIAIVVVAGARTAAAQNANARDLPAIVVRVDNLAGVLPPDLLFAEDRAASVFAEIGIAIQWVAVDGIVRDGIRAPFTIVIVNAEKNSGRAALFVDALGLADARIRRAHVFYDRVAELNVRTVRTIPSLLGDVIAHELGHLLLAPPGHSAGGIMRPALETKSWALQTFTPSQAREIRSRLASALPVSR